MVPPQGCECFASATYEGSESCTFDPVPYCAGLRNWLSQLTSTSELRSEVQATMQAIT